MPQQVPVNIEPGIYTEATDLSAKSRYKLGNRVRFLYGLPENLGGWERINDQGSWDTLPDTGDHPRFTGACRTLIQTRTSQGLQYAVGGTNEKLEVYRAGTITDITPIQIGSAGFGGTEPPLTDPFTTTNGSDIVTVGHTGHNRSPGDYVNFSGSTDVGGIPAAMLNTNHKVLTTDTNSYTIQVGATATSAATGGGTVEYGYEIPVGPRDSRDGLGWGAGTWGAGTWGTPRTASSIGIPARIWPLAKWGEDTIQCPRRGPLCYWDASSPNDRAVINTNAPAEINFLIVSPFDRHAIALGCTEFGSSNYDSMLIRWCSQNDLNDWVPATGNTAGFRQLDLGTEISSAIQTQRETVVFTDLAVYSMRFRGPPNTFSVELEAESCGIRGPLARAEFSGVVYWMGCEDFYFYDERVQVLPCDVRSLVFDNMNEGQRDKFHAGINRQYQEVWFFYCSLNSIEIDSAVVYNMREGFWMYHQLERLAWLDRSELFQHPVGIDADGFGYVHEVGATDNGADMGEFLETWDTTLPSETGDGDQVQWLSAVTPDFKRGGNMLLTIKGRKRPTSTIVVKGPLAVTGPSLPNPTKIKKPKLRSRQVSYRWERAPGDTLPWRMGPMHVDTQAAGKK